MSTTGLLALAVAGGAGVLGVAITVALPGPTTGGRRRPGRARRTPTRSTTGDRR